MLRQRRRQVPQCAAIVSIPLNPNALWPLALALLVASAAAQADDGVAEGFRLMRDSSAGNCSACHRLPDPADPPSDFGPALQGVGSRHDAATLRQWVSDARVLRPDTLMPPFGSAVGLNAPNREQPPLSTAQIDHIVAALETLK